MFHVGFFIVFILAYCLGSLSSAIMVCQLMGFPDPRTQGSQNPGATNVLRIGGKKAALLTLIGDMLKGVVPVLVAKYLGFDPMHLSLVALAAFLGHLYPVFFRFHGGKGVATALGASLALSWSFGIMLILTWLVIAFLFRYSSLAALIMMFCAPFYAWYFLGAGSVAVIGVMSVLLILRHRENVWKLVRGVESKIGK